MLESDIFLTFSVGILICGIVGVIASKKLLRTGIAVCAIWVSPMLGFLGLVKTVEAPQAKLYLLASIVYGFVFSAVIVLFVKRLSRRNQTSDTNYFRILRG